MHSLFESLSNLIQLLFLSQKLLVDLLELFPTQLLISARLQLFLRLGPRLQWLWRSASSEPANTHFQLLEGMLFSNLSLYFCFEEVFDEALLQQALGKDQILVHQFLSLFVQLVQILVGLLISYQRSAFLLRNLSSRGTDFLLPLLQLLLDSNQVELHFLQLFFFMQELLLDLELLLNARAILLLETAFFALRVGLFVFGLDGLVLALLVQRRLYWSLASLESQVVLQQNRFEGDFHSFLVDQYFVSVQLFFVHLDWELLFLEGPELAFEDPRKIDSQVLLLKAFEEDLAGNGLQKLCSHLEVLSSAAKLEDQQEVLVRLHVRDCDQLHDELEGLLFGLVLGDYVLDVLRVGGEKAESFLFFVFPHRSLHNCELIIRTSSP